MTGQLRTFAALILLTAPQFAHAEVIELSCEWQISQPSYLVDFSIDTSSKQVRRSDTAGVYTLLLISEYGIWITPQTDSSGALVVQTMQRSPVGGAWSDVWLMADGSANETVGGYCVEKTA